jgi:hypothetical protein
MSDVNVIMDMPKNLNPFVQKPPFQFHFTIVHSEWQIKCALSFQKRCHGVLPAKKDKKSRCNCFLSGIF